MGKSMCKAKVRGQLSLRKSTELSRWSQKILYDCLADGLYLG